MSPSGPWIGRAIPNNKGRHHEASVYQPSVVDDAASAIDFYVKAFDAAELGRVPGPDGKLIHAALRDQRLYGDVDDVPQMCAYR